MGAPRSGIDFSGLLNTIVTATTSEGGVRAPRSDVTARHQGDNTAGVLHPRTLLLPSVRPGGFSEEIFTGLSEEEKKDWECSICYLIVRGAKKCANGHLFCATCILTWSLSNNNHGNGRGSCPVCRDRGQYRSDFNIDRKLARKHVKCPERACAWKGVLREYRIHARSHGKEEGEEPLTAQVPSDDVRTMLAATRNAGTQVPSAHAYRAGTGNDASYTGLDTRITRGRQRLEQLFSNFNHRLERRGRAIDDHYRQRETQRQEQLREVHDLGQRLNEVSSDLMYLLNNMNRDSERYQTYIRQSANIETAIQDLNDTISQTPRVIATEVNSRSQGHRSGAGQEVTLPVIDTAEASVLQQTPRLNRVTRNKRPLATPRVTTTTTTYREQGEETLRRETSVLLTGVRGHNTDILRPRQGADVSRALPLRTTAHPGAHQYTTAGADTTDVISVPHGDNALTFRSQREPARSRTGQQVTPGSNHVNKKSTLSINTITTHRITRTK